MALSLLGMPPAPGGFTLWEDYWEAQGMPWRTEPEIDADRKKYLAERRAVIPDPHHGIYPFRDENGSIRLTRADVEWLLATHESRGVTGPVIWEDEKDKLVEFRRVGLDLRGADLGAASLNGLPLSCLIGYGNYGPGKSWLWADATEDQRALAAIQLDFAMLRGTHLEGAYLSKVHLVGTYLVGARLEHARLEHAHLERANMAGARLNDVFMPNAHLDEANLGRTHLERANLTRVQLAGADLREAYFDGATILRGVSFAGSQAGTVRLADVSWGDVNLAVVDWAQVPMLTDERAAWAWKPFDDDVAEWKKLPRRQMRTAERTAYRSAFEDAVRANRQLATALRGQGLNEHADRFAYRAQLLQRRVLWMQGLRKRPAYFGSLLLDWLAGYGYRPGRSFLAYLIIIAAFAASYFFLGDSSGHQLRWYEAVVVSLTAFHGRGFFAQQYRPGDPQSIIAALEAVVGLVIEISFIATFTKRFFG